MRHEVALRRLAEHGALGGAQAAQLEGEHDASMSATSATAGGGQRDDPLGRGQFVHAQVRLRATTHG